MGVIGVAADPTFVLIRPCNASSVHFQEVIFFSILSYAISMASGARSASIVVSDLGRAFEATTKCAHFLYSILNLFLLIFCVSQSFSMVFGLLCLRLLEFRRNKENIFSNS